ncbi:hypothetical protein HanRHA438_Chr09g0379951 [Helianthus annuus]|nr:hypothetical protein HanRHA438_Chr09g0379951 [Helianthus annuus]
MKKEIKDLDQRNHSEDEWLEKRTNVESKDIENSTALVTKVRKPNTSPIIQFGLYK